MTEETMRQLLVALCLVGAVGIVAAQEAPAPTFEVATVKANRSGDTNGNLQQQPGGRVNARNMPLRPLITFAYQLAQFQLVGGPAWITTDRFDIVAKLEDGAAAGPVLPGAGPGPMQLALRGLLADRFKLRSHRETREMDIYALVMAKPGGSPGPKLRPSTTDCAAMAAAARRGGPPPPPGPPAPGAPFCGIFGGSGQLRFGGLPASQLVQAFSGQAGRMIVDRTGLTGSWDFELSFTPEGRGGPPGGDSPAPDPNSPSFFTAIQEQLGLKLESTKGPVEVLVIDGIEHPTDD